MVRRFDEAPSRPSRAVQVWQILIGAAHNRQTITYTMLSEIVGFGGEGGSST
jgi:hypothetical protein